MQNNLSWIRNKTTLIILLIILATAATLRLSGLTVQSLSNDELSSWRQSNITSLSGVINEGVKPDVHPPGYQILLYFVEEYIGDTETILRMPSVIFGLLSVLTIYLVGKKLFTEREGLISASFLAVLWCPIFYSQDARPYSMLLFFTLLSVYFLIEIIKSIWSAGRPRIPTILGYIISSSLLSYTHYFGLYMVVLQLLALITIAVLQRRSIPEVLSIALILLIMYIPWIPTVLDHLNKGPAWISKPNNDIIKAASDVLQFFSNKSRLIMRISASLIVLLIVHIYAQWINDRSLKKTRKILFSPETALFLWLLVPFACIYVKSRISVPVLTNRNLIICLPAACLIIARSIERLPLRSIARTAIAIAASALLVYHLFHVKHYYEKTDKDQFRNIVMFAIDNHDPYTDSIIIGESYNKCFFDYYFKKFKSPLRIDLHVRSWNDAKFPVNKKRPEQIIYIKAGKRGSRTTKELKNLGYKVKKSKSYFNNGHASVWRKGPKTQSKRLSYNNEPERQSQLQLTKGEIASKAKKLWELGTKSKNPEKRIVYLKRLAKLDKNSEFTPQAIYMIGFIYSEELGDSVRAKEYFKELLQKYPDDDMAESARWMIEHMNFKPVFAD